MDLYEIIATIVVIIAFGGFAYALYSCKPSRCEK